MVAGTDLRALMRLFPSGVCVVTANVGGNRIGVTIGSLVSLSLDPPLVGISVGKDVSLHELLRDAAAWGVSLLRGDQGPVAAHFARSVPPLVLWRGIDVVEGESGAPLLADALAHVECTPHAEHDVGDHTLFVGEVVATREVTAGPALVYRERRYHAV